MRALTRSARSLPARSGGDITKLSAWSSRSRASACALSSSIRRFSFIPVKSTFIWFVQEREYKTKGPRGRSLRKDSCAGAPPPGIWTRARKLPRGRIEGGSTCQRERALSGTGSAVRKGRPTRKCFNQVTLAPSLIGVLSLRCGLLMAELLKGLLHLLQDSLDRAARNPELLRNVEIDLQPVNWRRDPGSFACGRNPAQRLAPGSKRCRRAGGRGSRGEREKSRRI